MCGFCFYYTAEIPIKGYPLPATGSRPAPPTDLKDWFYGDQTELTPYPDDENTELIVFGPKILPPEAAAAALSTLEREAGLRSVLREQAQLRSRMDALDQRIEQLRHPGAASSSDSGEAKYI